MTRKNSPQAFHEFGRTIVLSAANRWDGIPMADQQLATSLSKHAPVLYVDPQDTIASRVRRTGWSAARPQGRLTMVGPRLARISPEGLPGLARPGVRRLNMMSAALQVRSALRRLRATPAVTIEANVLLPVAGHLGEEARVFWAQDDFAGMAPLVGGRAEALAEGTSRLAAASDLVVAANPVVAAELSARGHSTRLIPFGCDAGHFASGAAASQPEDIRLEAPFAVFMGHLSDRIDVGILEKVASDGLALLLVGPMHPRTDPEKFAALLSNARVQWIGEREFEVLPRYLAAASVGLVPYTHSRFNTGSFPLKTLEYLASGLPVVSTSLPAIRWIGSHDVHVADSPELFAAMALSVACNQSDPLGKSRRKSFAQQHTWDSRANDLMDLLAEMSVSRPGFGDDMREGGAGTW